MAAIIRDGHIGQFMLSMSVQVRVTNFVKGWCDATDGQAGDEFVGYKPKSRTVAGPF